MAITPVVGVVDMATHLDISFTVSLGEYFSPSHFVVLYHLYLVLVSCYENHKTQKDFICFSCLLATGHLHYAC